MSSTAPTVDEIKKLLSESKLELFEEGKGGIKIFNAETSVLVGEFNKEGVQQRPGPRLMKFLNDLPATYFSPNATRAVVKPGGGSAGESQRKYTSIKSRLDNIATRPSKYMGLESLDAKTPNIPDDLYKLSPKEGHKEIPRAITYVKEVMGADGRKELRRFLVMSEAPIVGRKRADEVIISYTLKGEELALFSDPNFEEAAYKSRSPQGGFASFTEIEVKKLRIHIGDPNLEIDSGKRAAEHFEKTAHYMQQIVEGLFDPDSQDSLAKKYGVPALKPQDKVTIGVRDQFRTKEWIKVSNSEVGVSTLGRDVEAYQKSVLGKDAYRGLDPLSFTAVHLEYEFDPGGQSWHKKVYEPVRGGKLASSKLVKEAIDEVLDKLGPTVLRVLKSIK